jgi:hypothetical protein
MERPSRGQNKVTALYSTSVFADLIIPETLYSTSRNSLHCFSTFEVKKRNNFDEVVKSPKLSDGSSVPMSSSSEFDGSRKLASYVRDSEKRVI